MDHKIKVLFVCMGNICRSPLAEGIFHAYLQQSNLAEAFYIDSAGTSDYHVGASPDQRAIKIAAKFGVELKHSARQFSQIDFREFDYILVMDHLNYEAVLGHPKSAEYHTKVFLFRSFDAEAGDYYDVPDPYYGSEEDFAEVCEIVRRASIGFVTFLKQEGKLLPSICV